MSIAFAQTFRPVSCKPWGRPLCALMQALAANGSTDEASTRTVLVTGSTDGIGVRTACNLASKGWRVYIHGRDSVRGAAALDAVRGVASGPNPELFLADLAVPGDVQKLAAEVSTACASHGGGLDVLINNAGVFENTRRETTDSVEMTLAVNVVAPFMLCTSLWPALERAAAQAGRARIVNVSSISHMDGDRGRRGGTIDWAKFERQLAKKEEEEEEKEDDYDGFGAYGLSKLLVIMMTYSLASGECGVGGAGVVEAVTLDPGTVNTKLLVRGWGACGVPVDTADDETWAATSADARSGEYYVSRQRRRSAALTYDAAARRRVWDALARCVDARGGH